MLEISVIVPTRNRADFLKRAVESLLAQTFPRARYEILLIDNGSGDHAREVASLFAKEVNVRCFIEERPGLHNARHRGAMEAAGDILAYVDDDVIAAPGWLSAVGDAFGESETALAGGKILPIWEGPVPSWIDSFRGETAHGWTIGYLSLLDFGDEKKEISAEYVYGCNFSIRKSVLFDCGGFHPDGMPPELIRFRGDGETALALELARRGYKTVYEPRAIVYHRITPERLTADYFRRRAFNQGVSDSFCEIRRRGGIVPPGAATGKKSFPARLRKLAERFFSHFLANSRPEGEDEKRKALEAYYEGRAYHRAEAAKDPALLEYVLKEKYY